MNPRILYSDIQAGDTVTEEEIVIRRVDLLRYCGACGDFTATHWNERIAKSVGLPDVIAHGTFIIAEAVRTLSDWVGDPGAILEYSVRRFVHPVVVPDDEAGARLHVVGVVDEKLDDRRIAVRLIARSGGRKVMSGARAIVQLA
jgi:acyl dehydratase